MGRDSKATTANPTAKTASAMAGGRSIFMEVEGVHPVGVRRLRRKGAPIAVSSCVAETPGKRSPLHVRNSALKSSGDQLSGAPRTTKLVRRLLEFASQTAAFHVPSP